jgi:hypothetical protein
MKSLRATAIYRRTAHVGVFLRLYKIIANPIFVQGIVWWIPHKQQESLNEGEIMRSLRNVSGYSNGDNNRN